jgi:NADH dehydrogenase FAD-containing subunit
MPSRGTRQPPISDCEAPRRFCFGFSKLEVMFGRQSVDDVLLPYRDIAKDGAEFRQETVVGIDPVARRVQTNLGIHDADFLLVAMGADSLGVWVRCARACRL